MTKFCPECGTEQHNDNNHFCSNCGFDFSKLGDNLENANSDYSRINVPIKSDSDDSGSISSESTSIGSGKSSSAGSSSVGSSRSTGSIRSAPKKSSNQKYKTKTVNLLDQLSFNKCFLAFAVLLVIMVIGGMLVQVSEGPYSDDGLTSFMESSGNYDLSSLSDDSYGNDYDDYLKYGGDGDSDLPSGSLI